MLRIIAFDSLKHIFGYPMVPPSRRFRNLSISITISAFRWRNLGKYLSMGILETPHDSHHFDGDTAAKAAQVSILSREKLEERHFQMELNYQQAPG